ncbi:hypothetical protein, partial [Metallibacterium scheffleri]|uniref:hypothetical protein n=1 Tax=Metallibacterium scheffleri TaxID=993689 RepID=UPI0023F1DF96
VPLPVYGTKENGLRAISLLNHVSQSLQRTLEREDGPEGKGEGLSLNSGSVGLTSYQIYQELTSSNLTAQTTTSLTPVTATGGTLSMTATVTGDIIIDAVIRGSNNILSDGITVGIYAGTTPIDSETYTQEGVAGNEHTFVFHSSQTISLSTATEYSVMYNAVTGGTVSIKVVDLTVKEVS